VISLVDTWGFGLCTSDQRLGLSRCNNGTRPTSRFIASNPAGAVYLQHVAAELVLIANDSDDKVIRIADVDVLAGVHGDEFGII